MPLPLQASPNVPVTEDDPRSNLILWPTPALMTNGSVECCGTICREVTLPPLPEQVASAGSMKQQDLLTAIGQVNCRLDDWTAQQNQLATSWTEHFLHIEALLLRLLREQQNNSSPSRQEKGGQVSTSPSYLAIGTSALSFSDSTGDNQQGTNVRLSPQDDQGASDQKTACQLQNSFASCELTTSSSIIQLPCAKPEETTDKIPLKGSTQVGLSNATSMYAENPHLHWRRMIRKEMNKQNQDPLSKDSAKTLHLTSQQLIVRSRTYEVGSLILVAANASFIGWQVEYFATNGVLPPNQRAGDVVFCILFSIELLMRIIAEGCGFFFRSKEWTWNVFDVVLVVAMLMEQAIDAVFAGTSSDSSSLLSQMSVLRVLRLVRVVRVLKIIRMLKAFRELRMMVESILSSFQSLLWAVIVQCVMFYVFGLILTQGIVDYCAHTNSWTSLDSQAMLSKFGTLGRSVLSLFEAMCGGISWGELYDVLAPLHDGYKAVFLLYIFFAIFAVANIVTAVFVEGAMLNAQHDREMMIQEQLQRNEAYLESIQEIFHELDKDSGGSVSLDEIRKAMKDERVVAYLSAFGLDVTDVNSLFVLLDRDQKGEIDIDEFLLGCMRLKGEAKRLDMAKLQYEFDWIVHNIESLVAAVNHVTAVLEHNGHPQRSEAPIPTLK